ncbi:MAG TPA: hypothetical protein VLU47_02770, partial [Blastocatellia bacterium]|nr:hypothetical protein [Blastocatellia bacterium]
MKAREEIHTAIAQDIRMNPAYCFLVEIDISENKLEAAVSSIEFWCTTLSLRLCGGVRFLAELLVITLGLSSVAAGASRLLDYEGRVVRAAEQVARIRTDPD